MSIASRRGNDKSQQFPEVVEALARWGKRRQAAGAARRRDRRARRPGRPDRVRAAAGADPPELAARGGAPAPASGRSRSWRSICCATAPTIWPACRCRQRRARLEAALAGGLDSTLRMARQERGDGTALMRGGAKRAGWEGIVAKDARSTYKAGRRTLDWRKLKLVKRQELVIGGFTEAKGTRSHFGALLVGLPTDGGKLRFAGHVGGGFTEKELAHVSTAARGAQGRHLAVRRAAAGRGRQAALRPPRAGRRGAVRRVDERGLCCGSRSTSGCATISCRRR